MAELRAYQEKAIEGLRQALRDGKRKVVMALPTGGGKSHIFGQVISNCLDNGKTVLWLVHRRNLVNQMADVLWRHFEIEPGIIMAGIESHTSRPVQLCTVQTFSRRLKLDELEKNRFYIPADVVLIDEAHRSVSKSYRDIIDLYQDKIILGCTATPLRADQRGLGEVYDTIVDVVGVQELQKDGYLVKARYFAPSAPDLSNISIDPKTSDYVIKELE
ncbi:MAG: DEAD/DEAH box helicase family protein [Desulfobacterales bacterium]|nr:DEAD/DEAH box helicase family protein [Desulfobacterales bacterium]